jgi:K+-sensing histidine kinase KdpD
VLAGFRTDSPVNIDLSVPIWTIEAARLEAADQMRTTLLAGVGHDLRTPQASIKAAVSSLRQDDVAWCATGSQHGAPRSRRRARSAILTGP